METKNGAKRERILDLNSAFIEEVGSEGRKEDDVEDLEINLCKC